MAIYNEFTKMDGRKFAAQAQTVDDAIGEYVARRLGEVVEADPRMTGAELELTCDRLENFAKAQAGGVSPSYPACIS